MASALQASRADYEKLMGDLGQYHTMIQANLQSLRPAANREDSHLLDGHDDDDKLDVL